LNAAAGATGLSGMTSGQIPIAATATTITSSANLSGDVTSNATLVTTLATVNANVGTFQGLTVNAKGLVTAAANQGYGVGTLTGVTAGTGLSGGGTSGNPTVSLTTPVAVANGGTGTTSLTGQAVLLGNGTGAVVASPLVSASSTVLNVGGGTAVDDPLVVSVAATRNARARFATPARTWSVGCSSVGTGLFAIGDESAGAVRIQINEVGTCWNTTGTWNSLCDAQLKQDIAPYGRGLEAVLQLRPVVFRYNGLAGLPTDEPHFGLIANDVASVMPELVGEALMLLRPDDEAPTTVKTVDPGRLIYALVNTVKELTARLVALEAKVNQ
jgi:hypothetical protein